MIIVSEPVSRGIQHTPVNAAMLEICRAAFPDQTVRFYGEAEHLSKVRALLRAPVRDTIEWLEIGIPPRNAGSLERFRFELKLLRQLFLEARQTRGHVLLLSALESTILAVKTLHILGGPRVRVQAVLHGNLNEIAGWRSRNPLMRAFDLRSALSLGGNAGLKYLVLEQSIAVRLGELLPVLGRAVDWLGHPVPPDEVGNDDAPPLPLNISFLGLATQQKGFDVFVETARAVLDRCPGRVTFHAIGRLPADAPQRDLRALATPPEREGLSREDYVKALKRTHYVCLPYQGTHYELSASGVLLDAIAWCKPIIALPSPTVRELFAEHPNIGHLCETPDDLVTLISRLTSAFRPQIYNTCVDAMAQVRATRAPEALALRYRELTTNFVRD